MLVICINNKKLPNTENYFVDQLKEGERYTVIKEKQTKDVYGKVGIGYFLAEIDTLKEDVAFASST